MGMKTNWDVPLSNPVWTPTNIYTTWELNYYLQVIFRHVLPAIFIDTILRLMNKKPMYYFHLFELGSLINSESILRLLKLQRRIYVANVGINYFVSNNWTFFNDKLFNIKLNPKDCKDFDYIEDVLNLNYEEFCYFTFRGAKQYLLKEDMSRLPQDKIVYKR